MHWDYGWGIGMGTGFGWLFMILFWILMILGVVFLVKLIAGSVRKGEKEESTLDILKKRYARGEISSEEYEKMRDTLMKP